MILSHSNLSIYVLRFDYELLFLLVQQRTQLIIFLLHLFRVFVVLRIENVGLVIQLVVELLHFLDHLLSVLFLLGGALVHFFDHLLRILILLDCAIVNVLPELFDLFLCLLDLQLYLLVYLYTIVILWLLHDGIKTLNVINWRNLNSK